MLRRSLVIDPRDNVAILLEKADVDDTIHVSGKDIVLKHRIDFGHKAAIVNLKAEDVVYKYGEEIGYMLEDLPKGAWVHNHNMGCRRGR